MSPPTETFFRVSDLANLLVHEGGPPTPPPIFRVDDLRVSPNTRPNTSQSKDLRRQRPTPRLHQRPIRPQSEHLIDRVARGAKSLFGTRGRPVDVASAANSETLEEQIRTYLAGSYCVPRRMANREKLIDLEVRHRDLGETIPLSPRWVKTDSAGYIIPPIFDSKLEKQPTGQDLAEREYQVALPAVFRKYLTRDVKNDEATEGTEREGTAIWVGAREQQRILRTAFLTETNPGELLRRNDPLIAQVINAEIQSYRELLGGPGRPGRAQRLEEADNFFVELHERQLLTHDQIENLTAGNLGLFEKFRIGMDSTVQLPAELQADDPKTDTFLTSVGRAWVILNQDGIPADFDLVAKRRTELNATDYDYSPILARWKKEFSEGDGFTKWKQLYDATRQFLHCQPLANMGNTKQLENFLLLFDQEDKRTFEEKKADFDALLKMCEKVRELLDQVRPAKKA